MKGSTVVSRIVHESHAQAAPVMPHGHWWELTTSSRERRKDSPRELRSPRIGVAAARPRGARGIRHDGGGDGDPVWLNPIELKRSMQSVGLYAEMAESGDPTRFFHELHQACAFASSEPLISRLSRRMASAGVASDSPFNRCIRASASLTFHDLNRVAYARMIRHREGPRPTIVAIHGFTAEGYLINEWFFALPWFYRMGCDIALFTLPFHGPRQTRFSPFSGHGFFAGGSSRFNEAVAQSVFDFRILLNWLQREQGVEQVGVTGLSLGGFISAMLGSVEDKLAFALPNVPIIAAWSHSRKRRRVEVALAAAS
jgi:hypothetical protein